MYFFSEKSGDEEMCIEDPPLYKHIGILQVYMHNISRWFYKKKVNWCFPYVIDSGMIFIHLFSHLYVHFFPVYEDE